MIEIVIQKEDRSLTWLDVTDPKKKELSQLAKEHGLHQSFVQDCLDPEHLPKFEKIGNTNFNMDTFNNPFLELPHIGSKEQVTCSKEAVLVLDE